MKPTGLRTTFLLLAVACTQVVAAQEKSATLAVDGRTSANPSIAAEGRFVAVAWSAATVSVTDIYSAVSRDGGVTFSSPVRVNSVPGEARVNGELPPRVVLVPRKASGPDIVVVWTAKAGTATRILSARSKDGGRTFGTSTPVPGSEGEGSRGWQSVAVGPAGQVDVLWLDHRDAMTAGAMHHQDSATGAPKPPTPKADPTERAGLSKLYFSTLDGSKATQITRSVCYCCKTSLAASGSNVFAVWRHVYPGSQRDIAFAVSRDAGRTFSDPVRVSDDHWAIDGCPENGPAIAVDVTGHAHVVWPTPPDGKDAAALALFYSMSRDGRSFTPRTQIPSRGPAAHAQVVIGKDGLPLVAWDEVVAGTRRIAMARVKTDAKGKVSFIAVPTSDAPGRWYPVLATTGGGPVAAWVQQAPSVIGVGAIK
ncbi:MAG: sialidase family protein [bacterium]